jgi:hypothetical protein
MVADLQLQIEKLNCDRYGLRAERTARLLDQLEMQLDELDRRPKTNSRPKRRWRELPMAGPRWRSFSRKWPS